MEEFRGNPHRHGENVETLYTDSDPSWESNPGPWSCEAAVLIETYRILRGLDRVDVERMFPLVGKTRTREHNLRLKGQSFKTEMRRNFFSQRVGESVELFAAEGCGGQIASTRR